MSFPRTNPRKKTTYSIILTIIKTIYSNFVNTKITTYSIFKASSMPFFILKDELILSFNFI